MQDKFKKFGKQAKGAMRAGANQAMRARNRKVGVGVLIVAILLIVLVLAYTHHRRKADHPQVVKKEAPVQFVGAVSQDFGTKENQSSINGIQQREDVTAKHVTDLNQALKAQQDKNNQLQKEIDGLKTNLNKVKNAPPSTTQATPTGSPKTMHVVNNLQALNGSPIARGNTMQGQATNNTQVAIKVAPPAPEPAAIHYQTFVDPNQHAIKQKPIWQRIVPTGTFAKVVLLNGADANAGTTGQKNTDAIVMRVLDDGTLPNGKHSSLDGCFITASIYGDVSSERGKLRTNAISCVRKNGKMLNVPVEGTVLSDSGFNGIRGHVIIRNGKIVTSAGLAGFISGIGQVAQNTQSSTSTSAGNGTITTVDGGDAIGAGIAGGINSAASEVARYYIQLAELYHPVIEIHPGSVGTVVFLKPFSLSTDQPISGLAKQPDATTQASNTKAPAPSKTPSGTSQLMTQLTPQQKAQYTQALEQQLKQGAQHLTGNTQAPIPVSQLQGAN